ncbi:MAG TPA: hypothetical protein VIA18_05445 [Polyangia bacterium]|jgi:hypothetical protein|nr:hypothetical protein [Polyangia bacterium]
MSTALRSLKSLSLVTLLGLGVTGCFVAPDHGGHGGDGGGDPARPLGAQNLPGYRVRADAASELPANDRGFIITANGNGGYRVTWSDFSGSSSAYTGTISTDGQFDPTQLLPFSGREQLTLAADNRSFTFDSTPGGGLDGVDLVSSTDPIYLDAMVDGSHVGFGIFFTGAESSLLQSSDYDPVAFTSP